jgi:CxxC motif-containing protein (DUF1111 family)
MRSTSFTGTVLTGFLAVTASAQEEPSEHVMHMMMHPHVAPTSGAFQRSFPLQDGESQERFDRGFNVLNKVWVIAPSEDTLHDGLGPLFNQRSCIACHPANGRGHAPNHPGDQMGSALVKLSVIDQGRTVPHPVYGEQLNEQGIPGVPGEGHAEVRYTELEVSLTSGEVVRLRQPHLTFRDLNYGPMGPHVLTSLRVAPQIFGLGLLELVPDTAIVELAHQEKASDDGISGRPNLIRDEHSGRTVVGRFGWKANSPDLFTQVASAFREDMGLTSSLVPQPNCTPAQTACLQAPSGGDPEVAQFMLENLKFYLMHIAPPERRHADAPDTKRGETLFRSIGCATCHRETLTTEDSARVPELSRLQFHPYTDLLLHDMGPGLADGRPDHEASGSEWRTTPLWGVGLTQTIDPDARFLHDGRARTITEAIMWHGGKANTARERFRSLDGTDRASLLAFLDSL